MGAEAAAEMTVARAALEVMVVANPVVDRAEAPAVAMAVEVK